MLCATFASCYHSRSPAPDTSYVPRRAQDTRNVTRIYHNNSFEPDLIAQMLQYASIFPRSPPRTDSPNFPRF